MLFNRVHTNSFVRIQAAGYGFVVAYIVDQFVKYFVFGRGYNSSACKAGHIITASGKIIDGDNAISLVRVNIFAVEFG